MWIPKFASMSARKWLFFYHFPKFSCTKCTWTELLLYTFTGSTNPLVMNRNLIEKKTEAGASAAKSLAFIQVGYFLELKDIAIVERLNGTIYQTICAHILIFSSRSIDCVDWHAKWYVTPRSDCSQVCRIKRRRNVAKKWRQRRQSHVILINIQSECIKYSQHNRKIHALP